MGILVTAQADYCDTDRSSVSQSSEATSDNDNFPTLCSTQSDMEAQSLSKLSSQCSIKPSCSIDPRYVTQLQMV